MSESVEPVRQRVRRFFKLVSGQGAPARPALRLPGEANLIEVRGESRCVPALERLAADHGVQLAHVDEFDIDDVWLRLIPEPTNAVDPNALLVTSAQGRRLGYMARERAARYAAVVAELAATHDLWCRAHVGGGRHDGSWRIGVWLHLVAPRELKRAAGA